MSCPTCRGTVCTCAKQYTATTTPHPSVNLYGSLSDLESAAWWRARAIELARELNEVKRAATRKKRRWWFR
jgi:hypothetical protein